MKLGALPSTEVGRRLREGALLVELGPLLLRIQANNIDFGATLTLLYSESEAHDPGNAVADVVFQLRAEGVGLYRWLVDGMPTEKPPFADNLTFANFEWALHHAFAMRLAPSIAFHASVACRADGKAVAMIAVSGSGKSTLAAGLVADGWKMVADEYLVFDAGGRVQPMPGPITLKGEAIEIIRSRQRDLRFGPISPHEIRGEICQIGSPRVATSGDDVRVVALVFPEFEKGAAARVAPVDAPTAFHRLVEQSFNFHVLGRAGFKQLCTVARIPAFSLVSGDLEESLLALNAIVEDAS